LRIPPDPPDPSLGVPGGGGFTAAGQTVNKAAMKRMAATKIIGENFILLQMGEFVWILADFFSGDLDDLICVVFGLISIALVGSGSDKIILNSL
jgi:hypothetical protein